MQHEAAVLNLNLSQLCREAKPDGGQLDVYGATVCWSSLTSDDAARFEPIECRRDGGDRCLKGLGYLADTPVAWFRQNLEQADVVCVEVGVGAASQNTGLEFEMAKESGYALVKGDGLMIVDLSRLGGASFHLWPS